MASPSSATVQTGKLNLFLTGGVRGRVWLGVQAYARPETREVSFSTVRLLRGRDVVYAETVRAPSLREICGSREMRGLETRLAASGSGESAYF